jgi:YD repeat-containing protein
VLARDADGNVGFDDTEVQFLVIDPADILGILYGYDELNRLTRAQYPDGSIITYAYDPAGNRTNWTVLAGTNADTDGDGLPDSWEMANGMDSSSPTDASADADGDHLTNRDEFLLGTNPNDALSGLFITAIEATGSTVRITFTSVTGKSYVMEQSSDLVPGSWMSAGASLSGEGSLTQFTQTGSVLPMQRFFRVRWLP